jgi:hypothetical protein
LWSYRMHGIISIFLYLLRLALCLKIWAVLEKIPWVAEKNVYCAEVGWNFCRYQLGLFDLWCDLALEFLYWFFVWMIYLLVMGVLKSPTTTVLKFMCAFKSIRGCLMKLCALTMVAYILIIVFSFWCISPFISMKCPSFSHMINVSLKSSLSDVCIATRACFAGHWLGKSSSSLLPYASVCFCQWDESPVNKRLLDLPF